MKTIKNILTLGFSIFIFNESPAQNVETRTLSPFTKIEIEDNAKVMLHIGSSQIVKVDAENTEKVKTIVDDGKLIISGQSSSIDITIPQLTSLEISGSGKVSADSTIKTQNLRLIISGNGKIIMPVDVSKLEVSIIGNGKVNLSGKCDDLDINVSGNGSVDAKSLIANSCESNISGVGKNYVDVKNSLQLNISGSGSFFYNTKPANLETNISGIGKYGSYNDLSANDSTAVNLGDKKIIIIGKNDDSDKDDNDNKDDSGDNEPHNKNDWDHDFPFHNDGKSRSHWAGFEIGYNTLLIDNTFKSDLPQQYEYLELNSGKSMNVNLNFFAHDFKLYKRYLMFTSGLGMTINNYRFTSNKTLRGDTNMVAAAYDFDKSNKIISYAKNKLALSYVTVPLLLQFNSSEQYKKSFHVAAGILLNYKLNSHLKLLYSEDGSKEKSKRHDEYNIQPFRCDATLRLGYRDYTVYATYALSELFRSNRGPVLHPFQFGINFIGW